MKTLFSPIDKDNLQNLHIGDNVLISGTIFTARDAAHKKLVKLIQENKKLPFDLENSILYYTGPSPTPKGKVIGSCGPTTSGRMDGYTPVILKQGVKVLIGKGQRSDEVKVALKENQAIYCATTGGVAALLAQSVVSAKVIAFPELGTEAIRCLEVKNFPVVVVNDLKGRDLYKEAQKQFKV